MYLGDYIRDRCREDASNPYYSVPQVQNSSHQQHSVATSTSDVEQGNGGSNPNSLIITPTSTLQIHQSSQASNASSNTNQQQTIAPVLYRVVPTNYGNNSNASSMTRNETDGFANSNGMICQNTF